MFVMHERGMKVVKKCESDGGELSSQIEMKCAEREDQLVCCSTCSKRNPAYESQSKKGDVLVKLYCQNAINI